MGEVVQIGGQYKVVEILLSSAYFAPIEWYWHLNHSQVAYVEQWDTYRKQTYRNRCRIATANGVQTLSVPVERSEDGQIGRQMRDTVISDHGNWRHQHWNALVSAYGESPFFQFYEDDINPFFIKKYKFLYDLNMEICQTVCSLIDIKPTIRPTEEFLPIDSCSNDLRETITPKRETGFCAKPYQQVFQQKNGFLPNLSILDLLFNMGPESIFYV